MLDFFADPTTSLSDVFVIAFYLVLIGFFVFGFFNTETFLMGKDEYSSIS